MSERLNNYFTMNCKLRTTIYDDEYVLDVYMGPVVITNTSKHERFISTTYYVSKIRTVNIHNNELRYIPQMVTQK